MNIVHLKRQNCSTSLQNKQEMEKSYEISTTEMKKLIFKTKATKDK